MTRALGLEMPSDHIIELMKNAIVKLINTFKTKIQVTQDGLKNSIQPCSGEQCSLCCGLMQNFINASLRKSHWRNQYNQFDSTGTYKLIQNMFQNMYMLCSK